MTIPEDQVETDCRTVPVRGHIDVTFDFRSDTPPKKDPDFYSSTLRSYHKLLWSKPLPCGAAFDLDDTKPLGVAYLYHESEIGKFYLSSDAVIPSFTRSVLIADVIKQIPKTEQDAFNTAGYTMGGMMVFPGNKVGGKMTINGARGCHPCIKDRFELTVECIRRHYADEPSPLSDPLERYADFFALFRDFRGYVDFFLLQDLVTDDCSAIKFFLPFNGCFVSLPLPRTVEAYREYRQHALHFIQARNSRIARAS
jgi:hypothetical protein